MATMYRRGKTYWGRAQRNGREFRTSLKTTHRSVAEKRYREWLGQLEAVAWGDRPRRAFQDAYERFISEHCSTIKPKSALRYGVSIKWLADKFGGMFVDQIGREQLSDFETWRRGMGASPPTIRRDLACLSSILTSCEEWEWLEEGKNIVPGYLKRRAKRGLKEAPPRTRYLSHDEEERILENASPVVREAIMLSIDTGLRQEELFSLTWSQVDLKRNVITTTTRTKSGRMRMVPLKERSAHFSAQWKAHPVASSRSKKRDTPLVASVFVFRHENGDRLANMEKGFKAAARRAGVENVRWHDLRRTAGCRWLQDDKRSMEEVSMLLGHSSVQVTEQRYAFLENEKVAEETAQKSAHRRADYGKISNRNKAVGDGHDGL